jgi:hypothetical protein
MICPYFWGICRVHKKESNMVPLVGRSTPPQRNLPHLADQSVNSPTLCSQLVPFLLAISSRHAGSSDEFLSMMRLL